MSYLRPTLAALATILVGLAARAGLDKVLALSHGPAVIAQWAQLQSVVELVAGAALIGVGQGLTVLVAQRPGQRAALLRMALRLAFTVAGIMVVLLGVFATGLGHWLGPPEAVRRALPVGVLALLPGLLSAYWLGLHRQDRVLMLTVLGLLPSAAVAFAAWHGAALSLLLVVQAAWLVLIGGPIYAYLLRNAPPSDTGRMQDAWLALRHYIPVGLTVGLLGPAAVILVRSIVSSHLSWTDAGLMQAVWRSTEWVTSTASSLMSLLFLPRLSAAYGGPDFRRELSRVALLVWLPAGVVLSVLFSHQHGVLATLYDARFVLPDRTVLLFMLGDWVRVGSWVLYFGLLAARRTVLVCVGDLLSLPLFAALLLWAGAGLTLERAGLLYLVTYLIYGLFNALALGWRAGPEGVTLARNGRPG